MAAPDAPPSPPALAATVAATFLMGSSFIAGKILLAHGLPALTLVGWRFSVAAVGCLPMVLLGRGGAGLPWRARLFPPGLGVRGWAVVATIGLLQTGGAMGLLGLGLKHIPAATAAVLLFTNPLWVALLGRLFLGERLNAGRLGALALGVVGVALAVGGGAPATTAATAAGPGVVLGELLVLGGGLAWAGATVVQKWAAVPVPPWTLSFWQMGLGAALLLALAPLAGEPPVPWQTLTPADGAWFAWLALPGSTLSFGLWFKALRQGGATRTSSFLFLAPLFATVLAWLVLGAALGPAQVLGGVLIGAAIYLVNRMA